MLYKEKLSLYIYWVREPVFFTKLHYGGPNIMELDSSELCLDQALSDCEKRELIQQSMGILENTDEKVVDLENPPIDVDNIEKVDLPINIRVKRGYI